MSTDKPIAVPSADELRMAILSKEMAEMEKHEKLRAQKEDQLRAFFHQGFWQPMDTLRDKQALEDAWAADRAAWKVWK